jgi:hypothetical protein
MLIMSAACWDRCGGAAAVFIPVEEGLFHHLLFIPVEEGF